MTRPINLDQLSDEEWQALDQQLDALLDLDQEQRSAKLLSIEAKDPAQAKTLRRLLNAESTDQRIDQSLIAALSFISDQDPIEENTRIGAWRLLRRIGQGGMAEVYLAERADGAFEQTVALKLLWPGLTHAGAEHLVRQERQILAGMDDVRIARLFDGGLTEQGQPWLAIEYVDGEPINRYCDQQNMSITARLALFVDVALAVAAAHRQLIVHGDIKPEHVLVTESGQIKILDFGIGQLLDHPAEASKDDARWRALTPDYASPEQKNGSPPSPRSDVYQLGLLLRRLISTGETQASDLTSLAKPVSSLGRISIWSQEDQELQAIISRALAAQPKDRYLGADNMARDIRALLEHKPVRAFENGLIYRARCLLRRQWPGLSLAAFLLLVGSGALIHQLDQARKLAEGNAANEAVMAYLEDLLRDANPFLTTDADRLSRNVLVEAAQRLEREMNDQPQAKARLMNVLGEVHRIRTELVFARQRHERALSIAIQHDIPESRDRARQGLIAIGIWDGDYEQSEQMTRDMLTEFKDRFGPDGEQTISIQQQLADLLHSRGDYHQSLELLTEIQSMGKRPISNRRISAMVLRDLGHLEQASAMLEQTRLEAHAQGQQDSASHSATLDHRATTLLQLGDIDEALVMLDQADIVRSGQQGPDWDGLLWTRHWRALAHLSLGQLDAAARLLEKMVADYERFFSESSHLLAVGRSDLAWVALAQGHTARALPLFEEAIERMEAIQKVEHPRLAEMLMGLTMAHLALGRIEPARQYAARAFSIRQQLLSDTFPSHDWLINSCRVLRWSGGSCDLANLQFKYRLGLDQQRVNYALAGLCTAHNTAQVTSLPCDSSTLTSR